MELVDMPHMTEQILETGINDPSFGFTEAFFSKPETIQPLMEAEGLLTRALIGQEGIVPGNEQGVNALSGDAWDYWADLNYRLGRHPAVCATCDHILFIGNKPQEE